MCTPTGKRPRGRPRTHWRDYVSRLAWERLGVPQEELVEVANKTVLLGEWGLKDKVHCLITDYAYNMILCAKLLGMCHVPCFAHTLNPVVKNTLEVTPEIHDIRTRARRIVMFFTSSTNAKERLQADSRLIGTSDPPNTTGKQPTA